MENINVSSCDTDELVEQNDTFAEKFKQWIKKHKNKIIVGSISLGIIFIFRGCKNQEEIDTVLHKLSTLFDNNLSNKIISGDAHSLYYDVKVDDELLKDSYDESILNIDMDKIIQENKFESIMSSYEVRQHIRNLPKGCKASPEKIATALENNIQLQPGQTWVEKYEKCIRI